MSITELWGILRLDPCCPRQQAVVRDTMAIMDYWCRHIAVCACWYGVYVSPLLVELG